MKNSCVGIPRAQHGVHEYYTVFTGNPEHIDDAARTTPWLAAVRILTIATCLFDVARYVVLDMLFLQCFFLEATRRSTFWAPTLAGQATTTTRSRRTTTDSSRRVPSVASRTICTCPTGLGAIWFVVVPSKRFWATAWHTSYKEHRSTHVNTHAPSSKRRRPVAFGTTGGSMEL